jgi:hypothetical protein
VIDNGVGIDVIKRVVEKCENKKEKDGKVFQ